MTRDDIIRMARDAGFMLVTEPDPDVGGWYECFEADIERFAYLRAAEEREACAKICDHLAKTMEFGTSYYEECAASIRARTQNLTSPSHPDANPPA